MTLANLHPVTASMGLERYGPVTVCGTQEELTAAIKEPSANVFGVEANGDSLRTAIAGDELDIFQQAAATLSDLYGPQENAAQIVQSGSHCMPYSPPGTKDKRFEHLKKPVQRRFRCWADRL